MTVAMNRYPGPRPPAALRRRFDTLGPIDWLAAAEGYVMLRRPSGHPFTMTVSDWERLVLDGAEAGRAGLVVQWGAIEQAYSRRATDRQPPATNEISYVGVI